MCGNDTRDKQWKCSSVFFNSIEPLTFPDFKSRNASETEMTPIAKQSVFVTLQMEITSGMVSKTVIHTIHKGSRLCCLSLLRPLYKWNARKTKHKRDDSRGCQNGKHRCFLNCSMRVRETSGADKSLGGDGERESTEMAESERNDN